MGHKGLKRAAEEAEHDSFWLGPAPDMHTRLQVEHAIGKLKGEAARALMIQLQVQPHPYVPPALVTDGHGGYHTALVETWGQVPAHSICDRPSNHK